MQKDHEAMQSIQRQLDRVEWNADTLDNIADILRSAGYAVREADEPVAVCQNCEKEFPEHQLDPIKGIFARVAPGEPMPSGQCPECGALCHLKEEA